MANISTTEWIVQNDKIPRPPNCFIVFLSAFRKAGGYKAKSLREENYRSRDASGVWHALSDEEKAPWRREADRLREQHEEAHPDYRYRPLRSAESGGGRKGTKKRERAVRESALRKAAEKEKEKAAAAKAAARGRQKGAKAAKGRQKGAKVVQNVRDEAHQVALQGRWAPAPEGYQTRSRTNGRSR